MKTRSSRWTTQRLAGCVAALVLLMRPAWAEVTGLTDEQYAEIQTAFLREDFEQVTHLCQPVFAQAAGDPVTALSLPEQISRTLRAWLWYVLSLERLQRTPEALRELDRLKTALSHLAPETTAQVGADSLWPEILFWEGEISRKALQMVRARLAYQRVLTSYAQSSWQPQAQLGLGLVLFHQQAYDAARQQFHDVARAAESPSLAREATVLEALCNIQLKRFEDAATLLRHVLGQPLDPSLRAQVTYYLGEALTGLRRFEEAARAYQQALEADPTSSWAHLARFGLGWSYFQANRCRESLQALEAYLQGHTSESSAELVFVQGRCLMELGNHAQALSRFETLRARYPDHPLAVDAALSMAELLEAQQRFADAMRLLESVFRQALEPAQLKQAHLRLGLVYLAQGDAGKASAQFHLVKESTDSDLRQAALTGLGDAEQFLGNHEAATWWYEEAIRIGPMSRSGLYAMYQLGRTRVQGGKTSEAIELFQRLINLAGAAGAAQARSLGADARLALAFAYLSNSQPAPARIELERVRAEHPRSPQAGRAGYYLALLAFNEGEIDEAAWLCDEVIEQVPGSEEAIEAHLLRADLVATQTSPQEALAMLSEAVESLHDVDSRYRGKLARKLGDLAREVGVYAQAIHWYEVAWQELPAQRGELDYRLASCYEEAGDLALAIHRYRSITQAPWQIRGQLAAAKLMERENQWQEAVKIYERIAHQPIPEAKIAQERMASVKSIVDRP